MGDPWPCLTPAQELYLDSFDAFLRSDNVPERAFHRHVMGERLDWMLAEAGIALPEDTRWTDSRQTSKPPGLMSDPE